MDNRNYIVEKIKTVILVVLFLLTILLLYFFWKDIKFGEVHLNDFRLSAREEFYETVEVTDVIVPTHIDICLENGTYTKIEEKTEEYWSGDEGGMLGLFKSFVSSGDEFIEEITEAQYDGVMERVSAKAVFDYYLPFRDYCALLGVSNPAGSEMIGVISEMGFSRGSVESMFIYDAEKDKYFRIVSDVTSESFINSIEAGAALENTTYYPLESFTGVDLKREILVPAFLEKNIAVVTATADFAGGHANIANTLARNFFSGSFDFVRRIQEENGRVIFVYGYGEKRLTIDPDGTVSYRSDAASMTKVAYFDAMRLALATVAQQGGFAPESGEEFKPFLLDSVMLPDGNGYRFEFGILAGGEKVYYHDGSAVVCEVVNGEITRFDRKYIVFDDSMTEGEMREAHSAINVIAQNYEYIYGEILEDDIKAAEDRFSYVVSLISDISYGYIYDEEAGLLRPCYVISLADGSVRTYFDLFTAEPLQNSNVGTMEGTDGLG